MILPKNKAQAVELDIGDRVIHDVSQLPGIVRKTRKDFEGYNYLVDYQNDDGSVTTLWVKRQVLLKVEKE